MLSRLLDVLTDTYSLNGSFGVFVSSYDQQKKLLQSQGIIHTDQSLQDTLTTLRNDYFVSGIKNIYAVSLDIVTDTVELHDMKTLDEYDPKEYGFVMIDTDDDLSGVILPDTQGITDAKHALRAIKQKYGLHGKVEVIAFRSHKILLKK